VLIIANVTVFRDKKQRVKEKRRGGGGQVKLPFRWIETASHGPGEGRKGIVSKARSGGLNKKERGGILGI
jgi:hypothetical protein